MAYGPDTADSAGLPRTLTAFSSAGTRPTVVLKQYRGMVELFSGQNEEEARCRSLCLAARSLTRVREFCEPLRGGL